MWCGRTERRERSRDGEVMRDKIWCMMSSSTNPFAQVVQCMASGSKCKEPTTPCWYSPQTVASDSDDENSNQWFSDSAWRLEFKVGEMSQAVDVKCMSEVAKDQEKTQRVDR